VVPECVAYDLTVGRAIVTCSITQSLKEPTIEPDRNKVTWRGGTIAGRTNNGVNEMIRHGPPASLVEGDRWKVLAVRSDR
jgi:hypothetical protein